MTDDEFVVVFEGRCFAKLFLYVIDKYAIPPQNLARENSFVVGDDGVSVRDCRNVRNRGHVKVSFVELLFSSTDTNDFLFHFIDNSL